MIITSTMTTSLSSAAFKSLPLTTSKSSSRAIGASFKNCWDLATSRDHDVIKHGTNPTLLDAAPSSTIIRRHYHRQNHRNLPVYYNYESQLNLPLPQQRQTSLYSHHPALTTTQQKRHFAKKTKRHPIPKINKSDYDDYSLRPDDDDDDDDANTSPSDKKILILGSSGTLGKALTKHLSSHLGYHVLGADVVNNTHHALDDQGGLSGYVALPREGSMADLSVVLFRGVKTHFRDLAERRNGGKGIKNEEEDGEEMIGGFDAIVCASGGWEGDVDFDVMVEDLEEKEALGEGGVHWDVDEEYVKQSAKVVDRMMKMNFCPVVAASLIGEHFLSPGGLFVIIGASAALSPTPGMIGYGSAKTAAHHYLQTYAHTPSSIQNDTTAVGILPLMLDTPSNRAMIGEDEGDERYGTMVKPESIAKEIGEWIRHGHLRPHSGSLVKVIAKNRVEGAGGASFHLVR